MLNDKKNLQGLTLFLAELYSQLHYENLYGKCLLDALNHLISTGDDINVKCACQALKVCTYINNFWMLCKLQWQYNSCYTGIQNSI